MDDGCLLPLGWRGGIGQRQGHEGRDEASAGAAVERNVRAVDLERLAELVFEQQGRQQAEQALKKSKDTYSLGDNIGFIGLEKSYETLLRGKKGMEYFGES